jgi:hypothetical protein
MILFSAIAPKGLDWICRSRGPRALPPKNEGELRAIVIPPTDILVNTVELVNIAPTAKLFKSMTFVMHLSIGELEGNNEGESDGSGLFVGVVGTNGLAVGDLVGVPVASGLALGVDVVGKLFGLADGFAVGDLVGVPVASGLKLGVDVVGKLFGLADGLADGAVASGLALGVDVVGKLFGLAVGDLVGVPVASGLLALGVDVVGKLFGLADGLALGEVVGSAVSPQSLNDMLFILICDGAPTIGPFSNVNVNDVSGPGIVIRMFPPGEFCLKFSSNSLRNGPFIIEVSTSLPSPITLEPIGTVKL